jgi:hypothetical protein
MLLWLQPVVEVSAQQAPQYVLNLLLSAGPQDLSSPQHLQLFDLLCSLLKSACISSLLPPAPGTTAGSGLMLAVSCVASVAAQVVSAAPAAAAAAAPAAQAASPTPQDNQQPAASRAAAGEAGGVASSAAA